MKRSEVTQVGEVAKEGEVTKKGEVIKRSEVVEKTKAEVEATSTYTPPKIQHTRKGLSSTYLLLPRTKHLHVEEEIVQTASQDSHAQDRDSHGLR